MKKHYYILILPLFLVFLKVGADPIISFYIRPLPDAEKTVAKLKKPGKISRHTIEGMAESIPIAGILATYAGYITASNFNGLIAFPRKHQTPAVQLIVTKKISPITMFENTIHHWQLVPGTPTHMYSIEQKYDENNKQYYWKTEKIDVPEDNHIPLTSIVIIAKPDHIIIPTKITPTTENPNLLLPPVYVTKGINIVKNSIYMLNIRHLFKPTSLKQKKEPLRLITHIVD